MAKINHEEYEILKGLEDIWKWIARDDKGYGAKLRVYIIRPVKMIDSRWSSGDIMLQLSEREGLFQFIQWENSEPWSVQELIEECEEYYKGSWEHGIEFSEELFGKSEETEVKRDKEDLVKYLEKEISNFKPGEMIYDYLTFILKQLNELDEPETLSSDWINDNVEYAYYMTPRGTYSSAKAVIDPNKLENILVPKQEEMKVSKMWHDVIVQNKEDGHSLRWTLDYVDNLNVNDVDGFAKAWLAYPNIEVEEEQKYYIDLETAAYVAKWDGNGQVDIYTDGISGSDEYELHLTEKEIKDFDPRFWPFRKPVEEMEE